MASNQFSNGVALVTGAASGIGKETAHIFAESGCLGVVFADLNLSGAQEAADESKQYARNSKYQALAVEVDISANGDVQRMVDAVVERFGRIDYLVNAAGIGGLSVLPTSELNLGHFDRLIDVNLKGAVYCIRAVAQVMLKQEPRTYTSSTPRSKAENRSPRALGRGSIVNVGSAFSFMAKPGSMGYISSKHGLIGVTKAAALDHGKDGIRVNAICPGPIDTPLLRRVLDENPVLVKVIQKGVPLGGRIGTVEEVGETIVFLCSSGASYVTGTSLLVDAGATLTSAKM
ncbi:NAD(P)-binding protein [Amniculicola lignicola CBS 123094]|uniref:NAD(P)-binding protein n=1 Tax=Amniculicola lignicola CBS 123094 TaxID=1392246 RepID=A0A6A5W2I6_9PLEO|nr:NAD(P)-binding protein [Amniculicola lignicola CBS 123094]